MVVADTLVRFLIVCLVASGHGCEPTRAVHEVVGDGDRTLSDPGYLAYRVERERLRDEHASPPALMELLDLRRGATVVDIGTGSGHLAVRMARGLRGTGAVYATDIDPRMVRYVEERATVLGLSNLHAVEVSESGFDPFYQSRRFDRITMTNVRLAREVAVDYFRRLRGVLAVGGRLVIRYATGHPRFPELASEDFIDAPGFLTDLGREPPTSPFVQVLQPATRARVAAYGGGEVSDALLDPVLADINRAIGDPAFGRGFVRQGRFVDPDFGSPLETQYAQFLLTAVSYWGIYDERRPRAGRFAFDNYARRLNNRLFVRRFRPHLLGVWSDPTWPGKKTSEAVVRKEAARQAIEEAGWSLRSETMIPYHFVWVFE